MHWSEEIIAAHEQHLDQEDRRSQLIRSWKQFLIDDIPETPWQLALQLISGTANESELAFHVLNAIALRHPVFQAQLASLAGHPRADVRRSLVFYLSNELPEPVRAKVYWQLLSDKAASVRIRAIEIVGMARNHWMLAGLEELRLHEKNPKVLETIEYWLPLLRRGFRVDKSSDAGYYDVTVLHPGGLTTQAVKADDPNDPIVEATVTELYKRGEMLSGSS